MSEFDKQKLERVNFYKNTSYLWEESTVPKCKYSTEELKTKYGKYESFKFDYEGAELYSSLDTQSTVRNITKAYDDQVEKCLERYLHVKLNVSVDEVRKLLENFNNVKLKGIEDHCFIRREGSISFYKGKDLIFSVTMGATGDLCVMEPWRMINE